MREVLPTQARSSAVADVPFPGRTRVLASGLDYGSNATRFLGVLLCYNDADMLAPAIDHLVENCHDVVCWNHGSEDETEEICRSFLGRGVIEYQSLDRSEVPFRTLYRTCSRYLLAAYGGRYDWLSWPDQDELLHGPNLARPYHEQVSDLLANGQDWIEFDNYVFWFTDRDDPAIENPVERIKHYCRYACSPRVRAWRFSNTNERELGNHNPIPGRKAEGDWPLFHYPMRSLDQARRRIHHDRNQPGFQFRRRLNWHYERFREDDSRLLVPPERLHVFDGHHVNPEITWQFFEKPAQLSPGRGRKLVREIRSRLGRRGGRDK